MDENAITPVPGDTPDFNAAEAADVRLTDDGRKSLNQTRPWVRFMSIIVFICAGFMILAGLTMFLLGMTGGMIGAESEALRAIPGGVFMVGLFYFVMAILYVPPGVFLSRYASAIKSLESARTDGALENALKYQKSFWRYVGILTVIFLVLAAAAIALSITLGLFLFLSR